MLVTPRDYAKAHNMNVKTVQAYIRRGNLIAKKYGRFYLIEDTQEVSYIYKRKK